MRPPARYSFLLAIPAVLASGLFSLPDAFEPAGEGLNASGPQLLVATVIAFAVGYAAIAWLLRFVVDHSMYWFVGYRIALGVVVLALLATGVVSRDIGPVSTSTTRPCGHRPIRVVE